jgi:hypothetical protein
MKTFNINLSTQRMLTSAAMALCLIGGSLFSGCGTESEDEGVGKIQFQIQGEDITYDSLTGEDGYNHVHYATIEYAYMIIKSPKLNPAGHAAAKAGVSAHTGIPLSGIFAVDLMKETILGTVDSVEGGIMGMSHPSQFMCRQPMKWPR